MYRLKEIQDKLLNVVGWQQSYNPAEAIAEKLTTSESGLYFQGAHPLMTLDNVKAILPEQFIFQYKDFVPGNQYMTSDKVKFNGKVFISLQDNNSSEPSENGQEWEIYNFLSDYLETETRNGIATVLQRFITDKILDEQTKNLLERKTLFEGSGRLAATIKNRSKFCGFEIAQVKSLGVTTKLERIGLQFTGGTGKVKLYIFHSSKVEPYKTIEVDYTLTNGGFQWFVLDNVYLPYISSGTNSGGFWFIGYNQNELPLGMEAIAVNKDWSADPCTTCGISNVQLWRELNKYIKVSPFSINAPQDFTEFPEMWDMTKMLYTSTLNYGMNLELTVGCDLTDFIITQRSIFANVIQNQVVANLLRTMAMNPDVRVNRNQSNVSRMDMLYELDGNTNGYRPGGLGHELDEFYKALKIDTSGLDKVCLKCSSKGVRYRTV